MSASNIITLEIVNFKIWNRKICIDFSDRVNLLSGESGKGKSSILDAIYFCLYGELNNTVTYGEKKRSYVAMQYRDISIKRERRPNTRLTVKKDSRVLESKEAQEYINQVFGNNFKYTSYIKQNINQTFVYMSASDKLEFLEQCIKGCYDVEHLKTRVKEETTSLQRNLDEISTQRGVYEEISAAFPKIEPVAFPVKCKKSAIPTAIKNENTRRKNNDILLRKVQTRISQAESAIHKKNYIERSLKELRDKSERLDQSLVKLRSSIEHIDVNGLTLRKDQLESWQQQRKIVQQYQFLEDQINTDTSQLDQIVNQGFECASKKLQNLKNSMPTITLQEMKEQIDQASILKRLRKDVDREHDEIKKWKYYPDTPEDTEDIERRLRDLEFSLEMSKKSHHCPHCSGKILIDRSGVKAVESVDDAAILREIAEYRDILKRSDSNREYLKYSTKVDKLNQDIQKILERYPDIDSCGSVTRYTEAVATHSRIQELEKMIANSSYDGAELLRNKIKKNRTRLSGLNIPRDQIPDIDIDSEIQSITTTLVQYRCDKKRETDLLKEISQIDSQIDKYVLEIQELQDPESLLSEYKQQHAKIIRDITDNTLLLSKIAEYTRYTEEKTRQDEIYNKISELDQKYSEVFSELQAHNNFLAKIVLAETHSVTRFVEEVNTHVAFYIEKFFPNQQFNVSIQTEKELKSSKRTKMQVNLAIDQNGHNVEIHNLSGGERDRVNLAFTLALSEIFKSPLLLLDECIASLDYENCSNVLNVIRESYRGEFVLCVHHQANEGLFDRVVDIEKL